MVIIIGGIAVVWVDILSLSVGGWLGYSKRFAVTDGYP